MVLIIFLNGCSTVLMHSSTPDSHPESTAQEYYAGTKFDATIISIPFSCDKKTDGCVLIMLWPFFAPLALIDLPFSVIADTAYLPYQYAKSRR